MFRTTKFNSNCKNQGELSNVNKLSQKKLLKICSRINKDQNLKNFNQNY